MNFTEFSEATKIPYHTLYSKRGQYQTKAGNVSLTSFSRFIRDGGFPRLSNRDEVIAACRSNNLEQLAELLEIERPLNLSQLSSVCGIAYHTLLAEFGTATTLEVFFAKIKAGRFQGLGNRAEVQAIALDNAEIYPHYEKDWLMVAEMMGKKLTKRPKKQMRLRITPANHAKLKDLANLRSDKSKVKAFVNAVEGLALTFSMGSPEIGITDTWRPKMSIEVFEMIDEIILNHLVHLEPLPKPKGYELVANWAIEAI